MRNFRNLNIWKDAINIVKEIYLLAGYLPKEEKYGLTSQISRASISIPSNNLPDGSQVAEGCSRNSQTEYKRFLKIAIGSAFELETQLFLIKELNLVPGYKIANLFEMLNKEQQSINSLISKIKATTYKE